MSDHKEDASSYPALGRWFMWVEGERNQKRMFWALAMLCVLLMVINLFKPMHGYFSVEEIRWFYGAYGFVGFTGLIFVAKGLRRIVKRPEGYYGQNAIDTEVYPEDQLGRKDHHV